MVSCVWWGRPLLSLDHNFLFSITLLFRALRNYAHDYRHLLLFVIQNWRPFENSGRAIVGTSYPRQRCTNANGRLGHPHITGQNWSQNKHSTMAIDGCKHSLSFFLGPFCYISFDWSHRIKSNIVSFGQMGCRFVWSDKANPMWITVIWYSICLFFDMFWYHFFSIILFNCNTLLKFCNLIVLGCFHSQIIPGTNAWNHVNWCRHMRTHISTQTYIGTDTYPRCTKHVLCIDFKSRLPYSASTSNHSATVS